MIKLVVRYGAAVWLFLEFMGVETGVELEVTDYILLMLVITTSYGSLIFPLNLTERK